MNDSHYGKISTLENHATYYDDGYDLYVYRGTILVYEFTT